MCNVKTNLSFKKKGKESSQKFLLIGTFSSPQSCNIIIIWNTMIVYTIKQ